MGGLLKIPSPNLHMYELVSTTLPRLSSATHYQRDDISPGMQLCVTVTVLPDDNVLEIELLNEFVKLLVAE